MVKMVLSKMPFLVLFAVLCFSSATLAAGSGVVKFQGRVMDLDLKSNTMSVNEKTIVWDTQTIFHNENGGSIKVESLGVKTWVYIVGISADKKIVARKIYLIPKHIYQKEKHRYPFMEEN
jgi:hypothetical protein